MRRFFGFVLASALCVACATTGTDGQSRLAAAGDESAASADNTATEDGEKKQSLDKMLDEHDEVTLVDDDTGETKLVCRRLEPRIGTRLGARKVCATEKQWRDNELKAKGEVDKVQRNMDARCPTCQ